VQACLSPPPETSTQPPPPKKSGGMARSDVIDRLLSDDVLPADVAKRLRDA
jgi:hypothetical protein